MKLVHKNERHGSTPALSKFSCLSQSSSPAPRHIPAHWFVQELGQTSSAWITYGSMTQFIQALLDKIYTVGSLLTMSHWFSLICQRGCWAGNSVNLNHGGDRLKGAGLKNRQVSSHLLNKEKNPTALLGETGWGGNFGQSLGAEAGPDGMDSAHWREGCHLYSWHCTLCTAHVSQHISPASLSPSPTAGAFLHTALPLPVLSALGGHSDTGGCYSDTGGSWDLSPVLPSFVRTHRVIEVCLPQARCTKPEALQAETCLKLPTYPSAFRQQHNTSCSSIVAPLSTAVSTKA